MNASEWLVALRAQEREPCSLLRELSAMSKVARFMSLCWRLSAWAIEQVLFLFNLGSCLMDQ
jgi:hypothetical protein